MTAVDIPPGLAGVAVAETRVGDVRGEEGFYHYREYSAVELAERRSLEDVWALLVDGALPDAAARQAFRAEVAALRDLPGVLGELLPVIAAAGGSPMEALRTALSAAAAACGLLPSADSGAPVLRAAALRVTALVPTLVAALHRLGQGLEPLAPRADPGHVANYLWMLHGAEPGEAEARALEQYLITTVDHGFNASTFTARVVISTGTDVGSAVVGALGALAGPLHGGAPSRALDMLDEVAGAEEAAAYVRRVVADGGRVMGFGHRVYRTEDPRAALLRRIAGSLGGERVEHAHAVERAVVATLAELKPGRDLYTNVEYYAGIVMERCGIPPELFTPTFAVSRVIGWSAHVLEQAAERRIIRPSARYTGPEPPAPVPTS
jgi:citrate synthase